MNISARRVVDAVDALLAIGGAGKVERGGTGI